MLNCVTINRKRYYNDTSLYSISDNINKNIKYNLIFSIIVSEKINLF